MFEAYGWANVGDLPHLEALEVEIAKAQTEGWTHLQLARELNWAGAVLTVAVCRNHRGDAVIDLFRWIARNGRDCYGVLFVRDQESAHDNEFRVWRLARGSLTEHSDPFLSPCPDHREAV
jgi:hypothetical protein